MHTNYTSKLLLAFSFSLALLCISTGNLFAHGGHHGGSGHHDGSSYDHGYNKGYDKGYDKGYNHGWDHHYHDRHWHHDHWHNTVYVTDPWYNPGFVYYDNAVAYPYYYNGYPYYYYHPDYYWGTGVNINLNIGG